MTDFRVLLSALFLVISPTVPAVSDAAFGIHQGEGEDVTAQYEAAKAKEKAAGLEVERAEDEVASAPSAYIRIKRQMDLQEAIEAYDKANRALEKVMRKIAPGTRLWEATHTHPPTETGGMRIPPVGIGRPVDPGELAGAPGRWIPPDPSGPAEVAYGLPAGAPAHAKSVPSGGKTSSRWKARPIPGPSEKTSVSRQRGKPVAEAPKPAPPRAEPVFVGQGSPVHFVGQPVRFLFRRWGYEEKRKKTSREAAEEEALIDSAGRNVEFRDFGAALRDADRLIEKRPDDSRVHFLKAMVLSHMSRFAEAEKAALRAIRMGLETAEAYETIGWARLHLGRPDEALAAAARALTLDPKSSFAYLIKGMALELLGDEQGVRDAIRMAASLNPRRYAGVAHNVAAGGKLFDPSAYDGFKLVQGPPAGRSAASRALPWLLALAGALAGAAFLSWFFRRKQPS